MEQFDQLLTCCICLDRFKTPKLLPCQHSYCMEPCMEGLVDYVKRQVRLERRRLPPHDQGCQMEYGTLAYDYYKWLHLSLVKHKICY